MPRFHHQLLPNYSTLLIGHTPPDTLGFASERLQIWYNQTSEGWHDPIPHAHTQSDQCFIVLPGRLVVEVDGQQITIGESARVPSRSMGAARLMGKPLGALAEPFVASYYLYPKVKNDGS